MTSSRLIGRNIRRYRMERGLSLGEVGRRAGIAKQTMATVESGTGNPTIETTERIAVALGVSVRALVTEMGSEVLERPKSDAAWNEVGGAQVRHLDRVYGSGYVTNAVVRLRFRDGPAHQPPGGRGSLRHCFVIDGAVRMGPEGAAVSVRPGDFVRFPAELPHVFEALSPSAEILVCTTSPQVEMQTESLF